MMWKPSTKHPLTAPHALPGCRISAGPVPWSRSTRWLPQVLPRSPEPRSPSGPLWVLHLRLPRARALPVTLPTSPIATCAHSLPPQSPRPPSQAHSPHRRRLPRSRAFRRRPPPPSPVTRPLIPVAPIASAPAPAAGPRPVTRAEGPRGGLGDAPAAGRGAGRGGRGAGAGPAGRGRVSMAAPQARAAERRAAAGRRHDPRAPERPRPRPAPAAGSPSRGRLRPRCSFCSPRPQSP